MALPTFTNLNTDYYEDSSKWGDYQYTILPELVNNFMFDQSDDDHHANIDRDRVVLLAKKGIRDLYYDIVNEIISIELDLSPTLTIPLPHDYIQYTMIASVDENGKLRPMAIDMSNNLSQAYLQDSDFAYLYDAEGDILRGTHIQNKVEANSSISDSVDGDFSSRYGTKPFNTNMSKIFKNGSYRIDKTKGVIQFSSEADGKTIVLAYISDGFYQRTDEQLKIHKFAEDALYNYIYYNLIKRKSALSVPSNEKERARREMYNSMRVAKRRINPLRYEEVRQVLKGGSKWIKN